MSATHNQALVIWENLETCLNKSLLLTGCQLAVTTMFLTNHCSIVEAQAGPCSHCQDVTLGWVELCYLLWVVALHHHVTTRCGQSSQQSSRHPHNSHPLQTFRRISHSIQENSRLFTCYLTNSAYFRECQLIGEIIFPQSWQASDGQSQNQLPIIKSVGCSFGKLDSPVQEWTCCECPCRPWFRTWHHGPRDLATDQRTYGQTHYHTHARCKQSHHKSSR